MEEESMKITEERVKALKELTDEQLKDKLDNLGLNVIAFIYSILFIGYIIYLALQQIIRKGV
jgi:hypothetical protein